MVDVIGDNVCGNDSSNKVDDVFGFKTGTTSQSFVKGTMSSLLLLLLKTFCFAPKNNPDLSDSLSDSMSATDSSQTSPSSISLRHSEMLLLLFKRPSSVLIDSTQDGRSSSSSSKESSS